ncbi:MAG: hypothetical protein U5N10_00090 [Gemmobacter sp.]|nr:hypothetical protein [Gemmobacter sp.]
MACKARFWGFGAGIEGLTTFQLSVVMSAYFAGFLIGSQMVPGMIRRVGHVRVFAAFGSTISAVLVVYPVMPDWIVWSLLRALIGFSFCGVYITAESWLNNASTNETRGQALSAYLIVQMIGIIAAQALLNLADPSGFILFVIPSVLVSLAFTPILLSRHAPAPAFEATKPAEVSPRCSAVVAAGLRRDVADWAASLRRMFGMASVWGSKSGLSVREISMFIGAIYVGGLILQYPIGWLSDRRDRRQIILWISVISAVAMLLPRWSICLSRRCWAWPWCWAG